MGHHNSLIDLSKSMFIASLRDVASASAYPNAELSRDIQTTECRVKAEGLSFLTKTIPSFGKAIDKALSTATPLRFRGFKLKSGTQLPLFLGWLIRRVFDDVGSERSDAPAEALIPLRQVCALMHKLGVPTTEEQNEQTINSFVITDRNLPRFDPSGLICPVGVESVGSYGRDPVRPITTPLRPQQCGSTELRGWPVCCNPSECNSEGREVPVHTETPPRRVRSPSIGSAYARSVLLHARQLCCRVVGGTDPRGDDLAPRHGPGSVAGGEQGSRKMSFETFFRSLNRVYSFAEYFCFNALHSDALDKDYDTYDIFDTGTAKVVLVPKDSKGPRLISMEPKEYQWIQQGIRRKLERAIVNSPLSGGQVNFKDQTINRKLALVGSLGDSWVTLDMKDASDRVSTALVTQLFPNYWSQCLLASRTDSTRLPSGEVIPLNKFAPMGSSLCFPVESLVFWSLSVATVQHIHPHLDVYQASKRVFVYGDDIIVRCEDHAAVLRTLPLFHLMFSEGKCCTAGFFRESCGCDAYKGVDVTPLRIKCVWNRRSGKSLIQHVALHNAACDKGMFHLADLLFDLVSSERKFPYSDSKDPSCVCWWDPRMNSDQIREYNSRYFKRRFNKHLQRREILATVVQARSRQASLPGYSEMLRIASLKGLGDPSTQVERHHPLVRVAPADAHSIMRLNSSEWNLDMILPEEPAATAYLYTSRREVSLKRRWCPE